MRGYNLFSDLPSSDRERLKSTAELLLARKDIKVSEGPALTPVERATLGAQLALPVLELGINWYKGWWTIVVFPDAYRRTWSEEDEYGLVHEYEEDVEGEVLEYGSVILSRTSINDRRGSANVVIHEMAHQLDRLTGEIDGLPPLPAGLDAGVWRSTFDDNLETLRREASHGRRTPVDEYACESREEFFAVASERFFTAPVSLERKLPTIYRLLCRFYRQDPAARRRAQKNAPRQARGAQSS